MGEDGFELSVAARLGDGEFLRKRCFPSSELSPAALLGCYVVFLHGILHQQGVLEMLMVSTTKPS